MAEPKPQIQVDKTGPDKVEDRGQPAIIYSNFSQASISPEEACIMFGERDTTDPTKWSVSIKVYMSLVHMKRIYVALGLSIAQYEGIFGEIPVDPLAKLSDDKRAVLGLPPIASDIKDE